MLRTGIKETFVVVLIACAATLLRGTLGNGVAPSSTYHLHLFPCPCEPGYFECDPPGGSGSPQEGETTPPEFVNCTCIPEKWRCDGDSDCRNGTEEEGCDTKTCPTQHFTCANDKCIPKSWVCDGDNDCSDSDKNSSGGGSNSGLSSDEIDCGARNCTVSEFSCANGRCIRLQWQCDGEKDCSDASDELDCPGRPCAQGEFRCQDGSCVTLTWRCDQDVDCLDGSDELGCEVPALTDVTCTAEQYRCTNTRCVSSSYRCDGDNDCGDWSDENECGKVECRAGEFRCKEGTCVSLSWHCDGDFDCDDQSDELDCPPMECTEEQFRCVASGRCIRLLWRCDSDVDCSDASDEQNCEITSLCMDQHFRCEDGTCVQPTAVCDGNMDCPDGTDESVNDTCNDGSPCRDDGFPCQHLCLATPSGTHRCACKEGYELAPDRKSCLDVDECTLVGTCSHRCTNTVPGFLCSCAKGYRLKADKKKCKALGPEPYLLFANRADIRKVALGHLPEYTLVVGSLKNAVALDFHHKKDYLFWSDISTDAIYRSRLNGSEPKAVISVGLSSPGGLAVDWLADKIFWTDSGMARVEVAGLDGDMRKVLYWKNLEKPRALVVIPEEALLCWTDWGARPRVECGFHDGSYRYAVADTGLFWPNGLTVDYASRQLFWVDAKLHVIEAAYLDGTGRRRVIDQGLPHPFAITVFEDTLYFTDWNTKSIHSASKFTGGNATVVHSRLHFPMDISVHHPLRQPDSRHPCRDNNGGCSHLCLPNNRSVTCMCPNGYRMTDNKKSCSKDTDTFLIFARRGDIRRLCLHCHQQNGLLVQQEPVDEVIPVLNLSSAVGLDFDADDDVIYWSDITRDIISKSRWDGSEQTVVVGTNLESPTGIALDWVTKKLYWVDAGTKTLQVALTDGAYRSVLIWNGLERPRDIVVDPEEGWLFWTDWGAPARIERAGMDGSQRSTLVRQNLTFPNGLAIDEKILYWTDAGTKRIEFCKLDGTGRNTLIATDLLHPFGLSVFDGRIYWTDWESHSIQSADKNTGGLRNTLIRGLENMMDVRVFHRNRPKVSTECLEHNGGCSHLCLLSPSYKRYSCACPTGIVLSKDQTTCAEGMGSFLIVTGRSDIRKLALDMPYMIDVVLPIPDLKNSIAVDVDTALGRVFWSDSALDKIQSSDLMGDKIKNVITSGLTTVDGLAVDSTGRKLYYTDTGRNRIEVAELNGQYRKVLVWEHLDSPRAIVLHYEVGAMFWTDWGNQPRIERADMDGENRVTVVGEKLGWPNGLAIDPKEPRIVWADAKSNLIEIADLTGANRHTLVSEVAHPYGLTVTSTHVYWTDWETRAIQRSPRGKAAPHETVRGNLAGLMDLKAIVLGKVGSNRCGTDNGQCSHLCLRSPNGFTCACPTGIRLNEDGKSCSSAPSSYLLFARRASIRRISLDTPDKSDVIIPVDDVYNVVALDYDLANKKLYYTDLRLDVIRRTNLDGSDMETLVTSDIQSAGGLAFDWVARNLFWTDTGRNTIEVSREDGSSRKCLIDLDLDEPRAIALFPEQGLLFWSDWGSLPKIERAFMDGTSRRIIVATDLGWPNGLAIDYEEKKLYWADAQNDRIETSDFNGKNRLHLVQEVPHPFGLTQLGPHLYWTDWQSKSVERADKDTGHGRIIIQTNLEYMMEIKAVDPSKQTGTNACGEQNGGCSHLCLFKGEGYACACPTIPDRRPCSTIPAPIVVRSKFDGLENDTGGLLQGSNATLKCSAGDGEEGSCQYIGFSIADPMLQSAFIALGALALLLGLSVFLWKRRRRRDGVDPALTFSNPTYSASNANAAPDKKPPPSSLPGQNPAWNRSCMLPPQLRYDKSEDRVFGLSQLAVPCPPPPPVRVDSHPEYSLNVVKSECGGSSGGSPSPPPSSDLERRSYRVETDIM